jgi:hypothetical protein
MDNPLPRRAAGRQHGIPGGPIDSDLLLEPVRDRAKVATTAFGLSHQRMTRVRAVCSSGLPFRRQSPMEYVRMKGIERPAPVPLALGLGSERCCRSGSPPTRKWPIWGWVMFGDQTRGAAKLRRLR